MAAPWSTEFPRWTVKLYVTNFQAKTTESDLRRLFQTVVGPENLVSVSMRGLSAVVRVCNEAAGERAIFELDGLLYRGLRLVVRRFKGFKIFVGCVSEECTNQDLRVLFEKFGPVAECDIVKDYAFVHMENQEDGRAAIENLHRTEVKGRRIYVVRSNKDRRRDPVEQNSEWDAGAGKNKISAKSYEDQPSASLEVDCGAQPTARETAAYRNEPSAPLGNSYRNQSSFPRKTAGSKHAASAETAYSNEVAASRVPYYEDHYETNSRLAASSGRSFSSQSHSYEDQPSASRAASYGSRAASDMPAEYRAQSPADLAAAYDRHDATATPYATHFSDSLSAHDRASGESTYASVPLASGYRAQPLGVSRSETTVRDSPYERVRLSPPRSSHEDLYGEANAINRRYKQAADTFRPRYEYNRFSPPRGSHEDFDREGDRVNRRYAARPETAALRRPYERVPLSPPRNNHESKRYCSDYR